MIFEQKASLAQDAEIIRAAQERYAKSCDGRDLTEIYKAAERIAEAIIARQCRQKGFALDPVQRQEKARDAAAYVAMRFAEQKGFSLKSPAGYIYTCVKRELYSRKAIDKRMVREAWEDLEDD